MAVDESSGSRSAAPLAASATASAAAAAASSSTSSAGARRPVPLPKPSAACAPEVAAYMHVLALSMLSRGGAWAALRTQALSLIDALVAANRRTCDFFTVRAYALLALACERGGAAGAGEAPAPAPAALREMLLAAHRTATLRHDEYGQAVLLNLVLRSLLRGRLYEAAGKLLARAAFPEAASNAQLVRFLYMRGRVQAVALQYAEAHASLTQALRKAPGAAGAGAFRARALCASVVVQLLRGDIPARATFAVHEAGVPRAALAPYYDVTRAVRAGNLARFDAALRQHARAFEADGMLALVSRLQSAVIRAGLHAISRAYSRIATADVAAKLSLRAADDAEVLCAKAIRDGLVDGELAVAADGSGVFASREGTNAYLTREPQEALHKRIRFCLDVHSEAIRVRAHARARTLPWTRQPHADLSSAMRTAPFHPAPCAGHALPAARAQGGPPLRRRACRAREGGERVCRGARKGRRRRRGGV